MPLPAIVIASLLAAPVPAAANDASATHTYLEADHALVGFSASHLEAAQELLEGILFRVRSECPSAAAGAPQDSESTQLSNEVIGTMVVTTYRAAKPEIESFLRVAQRMSWSSRALTRSIHSYAARLRALISLKKPALCSDVRAWGRTGFKALPASTAGFVARFMPNG